MRVTLLILCGLVLDYSVHSNYCKLCTLEPKPGTEGYTEWMEDTRPKRKIAMMQQKAPAKCSEPNEPDDHEKQLGLTKGEELDGYRLLGVSCTEALVSALLCPECAKSSLKLFETGKGVLLVFVALCPTCREVARTPH